MKALKAISFCIGFMMLFAVPVDSKGLIIYLFGWLPISIGLLAYARAFKKIKA